MKKIILLTISLSALACMAEEGLKGYVIARKAAGRYGPDYSRTSRQFVDSKNEPSPLSMSFVTNYSPITNKNIPAYKIEKDAIPKAILEHKIQKNVSYPDRLEEDVPENSTIGSCIDKELEFDDQSECFISEFSLSEDEKDIYEEFDSDGKYRLRDAKKYQLRDATMRASKTRDPLCSIVEGNLAQKSDKFNIYSALNGGLTLIVPTVASIIHARKQKAALGALSLMPSQDNYGSFVGGTEFRELAKKYENHELLQEK